MVGSPNSSNSNRLREIAEKQGVAAYLIDGADDIRSKWLEGVTQVGVTAGASAPEVLVKEVVEHLQQATGGKITETHGKTENITFSLPKGL